MISVYLKLQSRGVLVIKSSSCIQTWLDGGSGGYYTNIHCRHLGFSVTSPEPRGVWPGRAVLYILYKTVMAVECIGGVLLQIKKGTATICKLLSQPLGSGFILHAGM